MKEGGWLGEDKRWKVTKVRRRQKGMAVMRRGWAEMERSGSWKERGVCVTEWAGIGDGAGGRTVIWIVRERASDERAVVKIEGMAVRRATEPTIQCNPPGCREQASACVDPGVGAIFGRLAVDGGVAPRTAVVITPISHWAGPGRPVATGKPFWLLERSPTTV